MASFEQFQSMSVSREALEDLALSSAAVAALASDECSADADLRVQVRWGAVIVEGFVR
jgi:hypothetical protein